MKRLALLSIVLASLFIGGIYVSANGLGEFLDGVQNGKPHIIKEAVPDKYKANSEKNVAELKQKEELPGYVKEKDLPVGAKRLNEQVIAMGKFEAGKKEPNRLHFIDSNRLVWVIETFYPSYQTKNGTLTDVVVKGIWDAETGDIIGAEYEGAPGADFTTPFERHSKGTKIE